MKIRNEIIKELRKKYKDGFFLKLSIDELQVEIKKIADSYKVNIVTVNSYLLAVHKTEKSNG